MGRHYKCGAHNRGKGAGIAFLRSLLGHQGEECVKWPLSGNWNGYGHVGYLGKTYYAHRLLCELAHGAAPSDTHEAAHSCGNGHDGCVNPNHLSWKTTSENQLDRRQHGTAVTSPYGATGKLTAAQRVEIRSMRGRLQKDIAAIYDVSIETISRILREDPNRVRMKNPFDVTEDEYLRRATAEGKSRGEMAHYLGRPVGSVDARLMRLRNASTIERFR